MRARFRADRQVSVEGRLDKKKGLKSFLTLTWDCVEYASRLRGYFQAPFFNNLQQDNLCGHSLDECLPKFIDLKSF